MTSYQFPNYAKKEDELPTELLLIQGMMESPYFVDMIVKQQNGEKLSESDMIKLMVNNPKISAPLFKLMQDSNVNPFTQIIAPKSAD